MCRRDISCSCVQARSGPYPLILTWAVTAALFIIIAWLSTAGSPETYEEAEARPLTAHEQRLASADGFEDAFDTVVGNCSMCHAREPVWEGMLWPPKGVVLETQADVARNAEEIYKQAGVSHAMPPPNAIQMDVESRQLIVAWYRATRD